MNKIEIIDYNKNFESEVNNLFLKQWNMKFTHKNKVIGKVALVNKKFAGVCVGRIKYKYFLVEDLCVDENFRKLGIATKMLEEILAFVKNNLKDTLCGGGVQSIPA